jgi:ComF family protein
MASCLRSSAVPLPDVLVPVPLHPLRLATRGYNQSALLGAAVARAIGRPMWARALHRTRHTAAQVGKSRVQRFAHGESMFAVRQRRLHSLRVMLVDDVFTTGATTRYCVKALEDAGATVSAILTLARTR